MTGGQRADSPHWSAEAFWLGAIALVIGAGLGVLQPLIAVGIGAGIYAGPTYVGLVFLGSIALVVVLGPIALIVRSGRTFTGRAAALGGCLALGMIGGNWLAASLHISFAAPPPPVTIHPTGAGWTAIDDLLEPRTGHTATLLTDGRVLVAGGRGPGDGPTASAELYDPRTGHWTATGGMTRARADHLAILLRDGRVLVTDHTGTAEIYDPQTGRWVATGPMVTPHAEYAATLLPDGRVLASGGRGPANSAAGEYAASELFDPATGSWSAASAMVVPRARHSATLLADGRVLVAGGVGADGSGGNDSGLLASAEVYDPARGTWAAAGAMHVARSGHAALRLESGSVFVTSAVASPSAELYDPSVDTWRVGAALDAWMNPAAFPLGGDRVLVVDGTGGITRYDPAVPSPGQVAFSAHGFGSSATRLDDGRIMIAGGVLLHFGARSDVLADVHLYDPR